MIQTKCSKNVGMTQQSTGCCYQPDVVTKQVLLPTRCCYQTGVVSNRCCYKPGVVTNRVLLPTGRCYKLGVVNKGWDKG